MTSTAASSDSLTKDPVNKPKDILPEKTKEAPIDDINRCCYCGEECNPLSQAHSNCMRMRVFVKYG